jgi:hypothetical protein
MPKYVAIGYGDQAGYDNTALDIREAAHKHDMSLQKDGVLMGIVGNPVQIRNTGAAEVTTSDGPYMRSALPVAGIAIFEAASLPEAIEMMSRTPCAVANGVVEVWPLLDDGLRSVPHMDLSS